jgi:hypothetical protein
MAMFMAAQHGEYGVVFGKVRQDEARQSKDLVFCLKDLMKALIVLSYCYFDLFIFYGPMRGP